MPRDLIFEIGTEELPASFILPALQSLAEQWTAAAQASRLAHGAVETHGTPRRLALLVREVAEHGEDREETVEGPAVSAAFDAEGKPTRAAEGFLKRFGLASADQLQRVSTPKGERLAYVRREPGQPATVLLSSLLARLVGGIPFRKSMRWGAHDETFARPVRWLAAVYGGEAVPLRYADVTSGAVSFGHRFLSPGPVALTTCDAYLPALREAKVLASWAERRKRVVEEIDRAADGAGGRRVPDEELLDTITGLVEWPSGVAGHFGEDALDMPREVLVSEMRGHQKYASVESPEGRLLPWFVAVANTPVKDVAVSRRGYERVLRARLADARFFFDEDRGRRLEDRVGDLKRVTFQERLGSIHDKVERVRALVRPLAEAIGYADVAAAERAATLCKADLTTGMVGEFPELQGVMGREYARHDGEKPEVALAVFEHYLPRGAGDTLPSGDAGALVGLADRLDTLAGLFALGKPPTGTADPFGLRRACLGVIRVILGRNYRLRLSALLEAALEQHYLRFGPAPAAPAASEEAAKDKKAKAPKPAWIPREEAKAQLLEFFRGRLRALFAEEHPVDVVEAVLAAGFDDVADAQRRLLAVSAMRERPDFLPLAIAFGRASNIIEKQAKDLQPGPVNPTLLSEEPERALLAATESAGREICDALGRSDHPAALRSLAALRPAVDAFFDKVLVMAEDPAVRQNRLRLIQRVQGLFAPIADFARVQARG